MKNGQCLIGTTDYKIDYQLNIFNISLGEEFRSVILNICNNYLIFLN